MTQDVIGTMTEAVTKTEGAVTETVTHDVVETMTGL